MNNTLYAKGLSIEPNIVLKETPKKLQVSSLGSPSSPSVYVPDLPFVLLPLWVSANSSNGVMKLLLDFKPPMHPYVIDSGYELLALGCLSRSLVRAMDTLPFGRCLLVIKSFLLTKNRAKSSDIELESMMFESFGNFPNSFMASPSRKDEFPVRDWVIQDSESWDLMIGIAFQVPPSIPKSEIFCQESEFSLQISTREQTKCEGV
ncbi:unnamed protein product [Dovyalis caffra]|uniref:Uncharacterized protein n=1 Tax=Dovyalis caffra TaxID=77055 RepID=A0AAV1SJ47_9ROSI|nr:unnamed protein product [Dovyalis caffra]